MKTRRLASSIALAAAIALGATGCGLIVPQHTTQQYAPSDGIDVNVEDLQLRNVLLIADQSGENFNVVFSGINQTDDPAQLRLTFVGEGGSGQANADFLVEPGRVLFGDPDGDVPPTLVSVPGLNAGDTVTVFFEAGADQVERQVPVLDGTLAEYERFVL